ncbi:MAG: 1-aminocyclopropane-1-carboxylate deaminase/D-cysteine desulfhydrase [Cytophagales bacterium]|nr:1-aminocyclopropane-1-carboxylate deaminase/D-cysteine desulfhydrase [Cytophagales bacterium]
MFESAKPTPLVLIEDAITSKAGIQLFLKREDLIHPFISGNKWRKLKYNLITAKKLGKKRLLTFGGAFSNHIYATAAAAKDYHFESIGIIRGEEHLPLNPTLSFAKSQGMELIYVSREDYRRKNELSFIEELKHQYGDFYLIPEGGSNEEAIQGCTEISPEITVDYDTICCAVGTGCTIAGIIQSLENKKQILGFPALKGGDFLYQDINAFLKKEYSYQLINDYHFGGYAKIKKELVEFIDRFQEQHNIQLDPIYTGKMIYGIYDLIQKGFFEEGETIVAIHTGGLQGIEGMKEKMEKLRKGKN